jgi:hypothetical protein
MIGRLFWFVLGAGVAVWAVGKLRSTVRRASPEALGNRVAGSVAGLGASARDFADRVRAGMAEREAELRAEMDQRGTGSDRLGLPE